MPPSLPVYLAAPLSPFPQGLEQIAEVRAEAALLVEALEDEAYKERQENLQLKRQVKGNPTAGGDPEREAMLEELSAVMTGEVPVGPSNGEGSDSAANGHTGVEHEGGRKPRAKTTRTRKVKAKVVKDV